MTGFMCLNDSRINNRSTKDLENTSMKTMPGWPRNTDWKNAASHLMQNRKDMII